MLPLGVANNLVASPNSPPTPSPYGSGNPSVNSPLRLQNDGASSSAAAAGPLNLPPLGSNYLSGAAPRTLGSEGGLLQTIQQGSGGLGGLQLQPIQTSNSGTLGSSSSSSSSSSHVGTGGTAGSGSLGLPNYPAGSIASGNYPSSLSSSGSLANLGIVPPKFDPQPSEHVNPSVLHGAELGPTGTPAPALPKESRPTQQHANGNAFLAKVVDLFSFFFCLRTPLLRPCHIKVDATDWGYFARHDLFLFRSLFP